MKFRAHSYSQAFTLVEISIVLVIVALVSGGVLAGQSLVKNSQLRGVTTQIQQYQSAVTSFKSQYGYLPGDLPTATQYWGVAGGNGSNTACYNTDSTGKQTTCNGNGDGFVTYKELPRFWQHLMDAGLITGKFSGVDPGFISIIPGVNAPTAQSDGASISLGFQSSVTMTATPAYYVIPWGNMFVYGGISGGYGTSILSCADGYALDKKIDDGLASTGNWVGTAEANRMNTTDSCMTTGGAYLSTAAGKMGFYILPFSTRGYKPAIIVIN